MIPGLCVPALDGAPGIYSARWAGPDKDFASAMARVHRELGDHDRSATFVAVLALAWPDDEMALFRGEVAGRLVWPPRGERGFGYDPIFVPEGVDPDLWRNGTRRRNTRSAIAPAPSRSWSTVVPEAERPGAAPSPTHPVGGSFLSRRRERVPSSARRVRASRARVPLRTLAVYVHWPFCRPNAPIATSTAMSATASMRGAGPGPCWPISITRRRCCRAEKWARSFSAAARPP